MNGGVFRPVQSHSDWGVIDILTLNVVHVVLGHTVPPCGAREFEEHGAEHGLEHQGQLLLVRVISRHAETSPPGHVANLAQLIVLLFCRPVELTGVVFARQEQGTIERGEAGGLSSGRPSGPS